MLSQWGILSIEMQMAMKVDQSAINDDKAEDVVYIDSPDNAVDKEYERVKLLIQDCKSRDELTNLRENTPTELVDKCSDLFNDKYSSLK